MKTVKLTEILDYYDGDTAFRRPGPFGGRYVGDPIDSVGDFDRYAVVGVGPERLEDFRAGRVDLRAILPESPEGEWYVTTANGTIDDPLILELQQALLAGTDYLPGDGYFLEDEPPDVDAAIQRALGSRQSRYPRRPGGTSEPQRGRMWTAHRPGCENRQGCY